MAGGLEQKMVCRNKRWDDLVGAVARANRVTHALIFTTDSTGTQAQLRYCMQGVLCQKGKGELVTLAHTVSSSPIMVTEPSSICFRSHRIYGYKNYAFELWFACGNGFQ